MSDRLGAQPGGAVAAPAAAPPAASREPWLGWPVREALTPYAFLWPTFLALTVVFFYPMGEAARLSLYVGGLGTRAGEFVGLDQYRAILSNPWFTRVLVVSALFSLGNVVCVWVVGLATALMLDRRFPGRAVARALFILPWAIPYVAAALIWGWMFDFEFGVLNYLLLRSGIAADKIAFLPSCPAALVSLTGVSVWKLYPLGTVMFLAALQTIPHEYYEAARIDGAGPAQSFWHVTLPGVRNVSIMLTLLITIWSFGRAFTIIFLLTEGGPAGCTETIVIRTYLEAFKFFRPGTAAALGVIVLLISLAFSIAFLVVTYRAEGRRA